MLRRFVSVGLLTEISEGGCIVLKGCVEICTDMVCRCIGRVSRGRGRIDRV